MTERLKRRGGRYDILPPDLIRVIETPDSEKIKNYRLELSKAEMHRQMKPIYEENQCRGLLVANEGKRWGQWT